MTNDAYILPPPPQPAIAVTGTEKNFRCAGYGASAAKPADALVADGGTVPYPPLTKDMHHEVELVVALKSGGRNIKPAEAPDCIFGYAVGIDLTRRDLQIASRDMKRPWEIGKAFDASAPCGPLQPAARIGHPGKGRIMLKVNGKVRQDGDLAQMIWKVPGGDRQAQ